MLYILAIVYTLAAWFLKASIVFLYVRLFPLNDTFFRIGIYMTAFVGTAFCVASIIVLIAACSPISAFWNQFDGTSAGQCIDIDTTFIALASINVVIDFFLLALPIPRIIKLQMTIRKKIIVITSLFLGIL